MKLILLRGRTGAGKSTLMKAIVDRLGFKSLEMDKIKAMLDGSHSPDVNKRFVDLGRRARLLLDENQNVIVEEAFLPLEHINSFTEGLKNPQQETVFIRLECSQQTATARTASRDDNPLTGETVTFQYQKRRIDDVEGELRINTDQLTEGAILNQVLGHLKL